MMQIRSLHEFGAVVWGSMLTDQKSREIERAQKSALLSFLAPAICYENTLALEDLDVREAPLKMSPGSKGHCPNSDCTPPPLSNGHSGALYFRTELSNFVKSPC